MLPKTGEHIVCGDVIYAKTRKGVLFLLAPADIDLLRHCWTLDGHGYLFRQNKGKRETLHKLIAGRKGIPHTTLTDHKNRFRLDNRRTNLRGASNRLNGLNRGISIRNKSGVNGVSWDEYGQRWVASFGGYGERKHFKNFDDAVSTRKLWFQAALREREMEINDPLSDWG